MIIFKIIKDTTFLKPVNLLKQLIELFTNENDVVIDPCAGSGTTLRACQELNRNAYGFEISRDFCKLANEKMLTYKKIN
jgi:site-specific DNA-methyltransferase (adenine-specific)